MFIFMLNSSKRLFHLKKANQKTGLVDARHIFILLLIYFLQYFYNILNKLCVCM